MIDQDQLRAFTQALQRLSILFMRIAAQQSSTHETFSKQEMLTLGVLGIKGACRMGEIAEHLGVVQSAVTPLVDRLEAHALVRRQRSSEDRRVWLVELTSQGEEVVAAEDQVYRRIAEEMLTPLSLSERTTLTELLERVGTSKLAR